MTAPLRQVLVRRSPLLLALIGAALAASPPAAAAPPRLRNARGLRVVAEKRLDPRLVEVTVKTRALPGRPKIRVLFPSGYGRHPHRRYPVLYLLHGTSGGAADWTLKGDAERSTAGRPLIVVMPDIALDYNGGGWCTNWPDGSQRWETFHIRQLIPWVDRNLRTIRSREGRAIAGLSQGGFCSMSYPARHPDLFAVALGYSGAPDIAYDPDVAIGATAVINATEVFLDSKPPNSMFGDRATNEVNWRAHDPATLAPNLRWTSLYLYTGNGQPGPLDPPPPNAGAMTIEGAVERDNIDFHRRLDSLGIPSYWDDYGPGTHSWPYWTRDLRESIGAVMADFRHPPRRPAAVTYTSADRRYSVYGWRVAMHRRAREFSTLRRARRRGFALAGSGSGTVLTPRAFKRGARYRVRLRGDRVRRTRTLRARRGGRLRIRVPLGPSNRYQQYTPEAEATGTRVYTTRVFIRRLRPR